MKKLNNQYNKIRGLNSKFCRGDLLKEIKIIICLLQVWIIPTTPSRVRHRTRSSHNKETQKYRSHLWVVGAAHSLLIITIVPRIRALLTFLLIIFLTTIIALDLIIIHIHTITINIKETQMHLRLMNPMEIHQWGHMKILLGKIICLMCKKMKETN